MSVTTVNKNNIAFELKGSLVTLTVLHLMNPDMASFAAQLAQNVKRTPNLFKNMPLILDLQKVNQSDEIIDIGFMNQELRKAGIIPVGIRNGNAQQNLLAQEQGLALLSPGQEANDKKSRATASMPTATKAQETLIISKPIRSGQQIYAKNANLVVLAMVNHGAELLADGYIHVYSTLRGRALAGLTGDTSARIFCHKLQAELISIAGYYKLQDDIKAPENATTTQIYLENEQIQISGLE